MSQNDLRITKEERVARLEQLKAPQSIINEEKNSMIASRPVYEPEHDLALAHRSFILVKTFDVGMDITLKIYEYNKTSVHGYPDMRLDVVRPDGMIEEGRVLPGPVEFVYNRHWMVDVSCPEITPEDVYVKGVLEGEVKEVATV